MNLWISSDIRGWCWSNGEIYRFRLCCSYPEDKWLGCSSFKWKISPKTFKCNWCAHVQFGKYIQNHSQYRNTRFKSRHIFHSVINNLPNKAVLILNPFSRKHLEIIPSSLSWLFFRSLTNNKMMVWLDWRSSRPHSKQSTSCCARHALQEYNVWDGT